VHDEARRALYRDGSFEAGGTLCDLCGQHVHEYRNLLNLTQAQSLRAAYLKHGQRYFHAPTEWSRAGIPNAAASWAKIANWGLIEEHGIVDNNPKLHDGEWRVTDYGVWYLQGAAVPKYVYMLHNVRTRFSDELARITDVKGFDYSELIGR
jgi:hypothetical protein